MEIEDEKRPSDRWEEWGFKNSVGKPTTVPSTIPELPNTEDEAWEVARIYFKHVQFVNKVGTRGWDILDETWKTLAVSTFKRWQQSCRLVAKPWIKLLSNMIDEIVELHNKFRSLEQGGLRRRGHPMNAPSARRGSTTKVLGALSSNSSPTMSSPRPLKRRRELSLSPYATQQDPEAQSAFDSRTSASTLPPEAVSADVESSVSEDTFAAADENKEEALELAMVQNSDLSSLWKKLDSTREVDPAKYFGDIRPPAVTYCLSSRTLPYAKLPPRLLGVLEVIKNLHLAPAEQRAIEEVMKNTPGFGQAAVADPGRTIHAFLRKMEVKRALFSSVWWKEEMKKDYAALLNAWGVTAEHEDTCVMIAERFVSWLPTDLVREIQRDKSVFKNHYLPAPLFKVDLGSADASKDSRLRSEFRVTKERCSIVLTRFLAWCRWCEEESPSQDERERELTFSASTSRHSSHRCGHGLCLIHVILEAKAPNKERDICQARARALRKAGLPVPKYCASHPEHPCLMWSQACTTSETFNIMASIALNEQRHWVEETETTYETRENIFPLQFPKGRPFGEEATRDDSTEDNTLFERYTGSTPTGFKERIRCTLCPVSFSSYNADFYSHALKEHVQNPGFLDALKVHRQKWRKAKRRKPRYPALDDLLSPNITVEEAIQAIKKTLKTCPLCDNSQIREFHTSTWAHLNTHFDDDGYLQVVLQRGRKWKAEMKREQPVTSKFVNDLLAEGVTKEIARDLIKELATRGGWR